MKIWPFENGHDVGTPCWIAGKEADIKKLVPGRIMTNAGDAIEITYTWIDGTGHTFYEKQDGYINRTLLKELGIEIPNDSPVFAHDVGHIWGTALEKQTLEQYLLEKSKIPEGEVCNIVTIGSEYANIIAENNLGRDLVQGIIDNRPAGPLPWKYIMIGVLAIVGGIILWKSGVLTTLINSLTSSLPGGS